MLFKHGREVVAAALTSAVYAGFAVPAAHGSFHEWRISEIYSNNTGSVQFIEFQLPSLISDDERFLTFASLSETVSGRNFPFPNNLPGAPLANQYFLVGTPGYAALAGVPPADYTLPFNNWFNPSGDTVKYAGGLDSIVLTAGLLPTDGIHSLRRENGAANFTEQTSFATNFAGQSGAVVVPEPSILTLATIGLVPLVLRRRRSFVAGQPN